MSKKTEPASRAEQADPKVINLAFAVGDTVWMMHENLARRVSVDRVSVEQTAYRRDREHEPTIVIRVMLQVTSLDTDEGKAWFTNKSIADDQCFATKQALLDSL